MKTRNWLTLLIALPLLLAGCGPAEPSALSDEEVLTLATGILTAVDDNNYDVFKENFSEEMLAAFPEAAFADLRTTLQSASGNFVSAGRLELTNNQGYAVHRIRCTYSLEEVMVTLVIKIGGTQVDGLFFDSTNLRAASK